MSKRMNNLFRFYIFIAIYSNVLRVILGKWATLAADIVLISILIYVIFKEKKLKIVFRRADSGLVFCIIMLQVIAIFELFNPNIINKLYSVIEYRKSIFQILAFFVAYYCSDKEKFWDNLKFIQWCLIPTIIYGIKQSIAYSNIDSIFYKLQDAATDTLQYGGNLRSISIFSGPFHFGMVCAITLCISLALLKNKKEKKQFFFILLCLLGAYYSLTRTNLLCCLIVLVVYNMYFFKKANTKNDYMKKILIMLILIISGTLLYFWYTENQSANNTIIDIIYSIININSDNRFIGRIVTWKKALKMINMHPFMGFGIGSAGDTLSYFKVAKESVTPHNMFIKLAVETGLIGLILIIFLFVFSLIKCLRTKDINQSFFIFLCFIVILLNSLVGSTISTFPIMSLFWIFIGMILKY